MKRESTKHARRRKEAEPVRQSLIEEVGECEFCKRDERTVLRDAWQPYGLCVHEICRGCDRMKTLDQRCATLVLCSDCHREMDGMPRAAQLAILYLSRSSDYSLSDFWTLQCRRTPEQVDVDLWIRRLLGNQR